MKKKLRKINVNGENYLWVCGRPNCDGNYNNLLTIYHNKKQVYTELVSGSLNMTPKKVSEIILTKVETLIKLSR